MHERLTLRPITPDDQDLLYRLYVSTRWKELAQVPWTEEQKLAFLRQQFDAQHAYWTENYRGATFDVVLMDGVPAGRLYVARWERELRIVDIALFPEHRGRGLGTTLLRRVFAEAEAVGKATSIHVEIFNPARALYERLGFRLVEEKGVYLLMKRPAGASAPV